MNLAEDLKIQREEIERLRKWKEDATALNSRTATKRVELEKRIKELEAERSELRKVIHERYNHLKWLKEVNTTPPSVIDEIMFLESILNSIKKEL